MLDLIRTFINRVRGAWVIFERQGPSSSKVRIYWYHKARAVEPSLTIDAEALGHPTKMILALGEDMLATGSTPFWCYKGDKDIQPLTTLLP